MNPGPYFIIIVVLVCALINVLMSVHVMRMHGCFLLGNHSKRNLHISILWKQGCGPTEHYPIITHSLSRADQSESKSVTTNSWSLPVVRVGERRPAPLGCDGYSDSAQ